MRILLHHLLSTISIGRNINRSKLFSIKKFSKIFPNLFSHLYCTVCRDESRRPIGAWEIADEIILPPIDKRTDVWSRPSCIYTQIFSPKKKLLFRFFVIKKKFFFKGIMQLFSVFKKIYIFFFTPKKGKNRTQMLLIIGPDPFISQSSPDHIPQPRIDFSYYEISGPDICSLICDCQCM